MFRVTPALRTVLATPFLTRWVFDCEIIARFASLATRGELIPVADSQSIAESRPVSLSEAIYEYPLEEWIDVAGSKVKPTDILRMAFGLARIRCVYFLFEWPSGRPRPALYVTILILFVGALFVMLFVVALSFLLYRGWMSG